jgi:hypothetical protein
MNAFWSYFWPVFAVGLLMGGIFGTIAFRKQRQAMLWIGGLVSVAGAALWHGPLGAADRFATQVENVAEFVLADWEMAQVEAQLQKSPLTRRLMLSGPADDFQRTELVRMMSTIPGVSTATWSDDGGWPLLLEAAGASVLGFLLGLLLAYVVELRRRHNAQWTW